jgi:Type II intron maturase
MIFNNDRKHDRRGHRSINGQVGLKVPKSVIAEKSQPFRRHGKPVARKERTEDTPYSIIAQYQQEYRGLAEYYQLAVNRYQLNRLKWVMERSLVATLAEKLRITISQVYDRYETTLETPDGPRKVLQATIEREGKRPLVAYWGGISLARNMKAILTDTIPWTWGERSELEKRLLADTCELCGSHEQVEVHHIRADVQISKRKDRESVRVGCLLWQPDDEKRWLCVDAVMKIFMQDEREGNIQGHENTREPRATETGMRGSEGGIRKRAAMHLAGYLPYFLVGIQGSKADAEEVKNWLEAYLRNELQLDLSMEKTLITNAKERIRFLGYDIKRWPGRHIKRLHTRQGIQTRRTTSYHLGLLMPADKTIKFAQEYGETNTWQGKHRSKLLNLSELEILMTYNAEVRGFLEYYSLADNLKDAAGRVLWITQRSFFCTLAGKRKCSIKKVVKSLKKGPNRFVISVDRGGKGIKEYELIASTKQLKTDKVTYDRVDLIPKTWMYQSRNELTKRLLADECEWCGIRGSQVEVHHIRKLGNLKGKTPWERQMIERRRKTMVLCVECHHELHAGTLSEQKKMLRKNRRAGYTENV